jgi:hypothetical protein
MRLRKDDDFGGLGSSNSPSNSNSSSDFASSSKKKKAAEPFKFCVLIVIILLGLFMTILVLGRIYQTGNQSTTDSLRTSTDAYLQAGVDFVDHFLPFLHKINPASQSLRIGRSSNESSYTTKKNSTPLRHNDQSSKIANDCESLWLPDKIIGRCFGLTTSTDLPKKFNVPKNYTIKSAGDCLRLCCELG